MEDIFLSKDIDSTRTICISPLSASTYKSAGGKGLGGDYGYFIYEYDRSKPDHGIEIIAKAVSVEAALKLFDLFKITQQKN